MKWFEQLREEFPVTRKEIYVDMALRNPMARSVADAMISFWRDVLEGQADKEQWREREDLVRLALARLVNGDPAGIAFTKNTAEGINIVARGMRLGPGDNVVVNDQDHSNNILPWLNLQAEGVEVRVVKARDHRLPVESIWASVDERTKAVALSFVQHRTGFRADIAALGELGRRNGTRIVVDAIQGLGTIRFDAEAWGVDAVAAGGHKGLLGPHGIGFLYCRRAFLETLEPVYAGSSAVVGVDTAKGFRVAVRERADARRLEMGTLNHAGITGLGKGIDLLERVGIGRIEERVLGLAQELALGLRGLGYTVISSPDPRERSGIVTVIVPDAGRFARYLLDHNIRASEKADGAVRFSPHAYNLESEVSTVLDAATGYLER